MKVPIKNQTQNRASMVEVDLQVAVDAENLPSQVQLQDWINAVVDPDQDAELTVRIVDEEEMTQLNSTYRHKPSVTNVLSFPFEADIPMDVTLLGDLVICAPVVEREAREQAKTAEAHWAHLVIHGTLHLLGFDHVNEDDAHRMESREIKILHQFGYANPYEVNTNS